MCSSAVTSFSRKRVPAATEARRWRQAEAGGAVKAVIDEGEGSDGCECVCVCVRGKGNNKCWRHHVISLWSLIVSRKSKFLTFVKSVQLLPKEASKRCQTKIPQTFWHTATQGTIEHTHSLSLAHTHTHTGTNIRKTSNLRLRMSSGIPAAAGSGAAPTAAGWPLSAGSAKAAVAAAAEADTKSQIQVMRPGVIWARACEGGRVATHRGRAQTSL